MEWAPASLCPWWDRLWRETFWLHNTRPYTHGKVKLVLFRQLEFWHFLTLNAAVSNFSIYPAGLCIRGVKHASCHVLWTALPVKGNAFFPPVKWLNVLYCSFNNSYFRHFTCMVVRLVRNNMGTGINIAEESRSDDVLHYIWGSST